MYNIFWWQVWSDSELHRQIIHQNDGISMIKWLKSRFKCKYCARVKIVLKKIDWFNLLCLKSFSKVKKY